MRDAEIGRIVRALRRRNGWRQEDVAQRAGVHRSTVSLIERGLLGRMTVETVRRPLEALEASLELVARWRGADVDRLLDEQHSRLQAAWKQRLERWDWTVIAEASFNHYGDRGRVDLLAWHAQRRIMVIVEIKTLIADVQGLLGPLDVKTRVAPWIAAERGWTRPLLVVPLLLLHESAASRRRLASLEPLFSRFSVRGRAAVSWLRRPVGAPAGLLVLSDLSPASLIRVRRVGRQRVRLASPKPSTDGTSRGPSRGRGVA